MVDTATWWRELGRTVPPGEAFGRNIAEVRRHVGLDQAAVARRLTALGIKAGQNTVSRIENAGRPVTIDEYVALAHILGVAEDQRDFLLADPADREVSRREHLKREIQALEIQRNRVWSGMQEQQYEVERMERDLSALREELRREMDDGEH